VWQGALKLKLPDKHNPPSLSKVPLFSPERRYPWWAALLALVVGMVVPPAYIVLLW
jgi:hypothetical protein